MTEIWEARMGREVRSVSWKGLCALRAPRDVWKETFISPFNSLMFPSVKIIASYLFSELVQQPLSWSPYTFPCPYSIFQISKNSVLNTIFVRSLSSHYKWQNFNSNRFQLEMKFIDLGWKFECSTGFQHCWSPTLKQWSSFSLCLFFSASLCIAVLLDQLFNYCVKMPSITSRHEDNILPNEKPQKRESILSPSVVLE